MEIQTPIASRIKLLPKLVLQSVSFQFQTYMIFLSIPRNSSFTNNFIFLSIFWDLVVLCMCPLHFVTLQNQSLRHGFMHQWFTGKSTRGREVSQKREKKTSLTVEKVWEMVWDTFFREDLWCVKEAAEKLMHQFPPALASGLFWGLWTVWYFCLTQVRVQHPLFLLKMEWNMG